MTTPPDRAPPDRALSVAASERPLDKIRRVLRDDQTKIVLAAFTLFLLVHYWRYTPCKHANESETLESCRNEGGMRVNAIVQFAIRGVLLMALVIQVLHFFKLPVLPFLTATGLTTAAIGYMFLHQIQDFIAGSLLLISRTVEVGDVVHLKVFNVSMADTQPITIENLRPMHIQGYFVDDQGRRITVLVHYRHIFRLEKFPN